MKSLADPKKWGRGTISFWAAVSLALFSLIVPKSDGLLTTSAGARASDGIRVVSQDGMGFVLELRTSRFDSTEVQVNGTTYQRITIPTYTHGLTQRAGSPELPVKGYWVDLPKGMSIELELENLETETSSGYLVYPVPQKIALDEEVVEEFAIDYGAYAEDRFSPEQRVRKGTAAFLRDQKKAQVLFSPISFNPQSGELQLHTLIQARVSYISDAVSAMQASGHRAALFGAEAAHPAWFSPSDYLYKIITTEEGIYRVTAGELKAVGMNLDAIDPRNLHLYNQGTEVAIHVSDQGMIGSFDDGDYILFYAEPVTTKYTKNNGYWLVAEDTPGLRMAESDGIPDPGTPLAGDFISTVHHERDRFYWGQAPGEDSFDRWFFDLHLMVRAGTAVDFPVDLPGVSTSAWTATVTVALRGAEEDKLHQATFSINGVQIAQESWQGQDEYRVEVDIDQRLLVPGKNTITIALLGSDDNLLLDWIEVAYLRTFEATDNSLKFSSDPGYVFVIPGFSTNDLVVLDITFPLQAVKILATPEDPPYTLRFQGQGAGPRTYIASTPKAVQGITQVAPPDLMDTQNGADYIIITHRDIGWDPTTGEAYSWLRDLSGHRESKGLRVVAVDIDEIYDTFNYGIADPQAIKDFLAYAYHNWSRPAPQYVVLVGDTTFDPKGNFFPPQPEVPTYLGWTPYMGETAMDDWFTQIVGDDAIGDLYLGRLPAAHNGEAQIMVAKIIDYEESPRGQPWQKRLLLVADDEEPIFEQTKEAVAALVPADYGLTKGYLSEYKIPPNTLQDLTNLIVDEINQGVLIVNYAGHGLTQYWAHEKIFDANRDIPMLSNDQRLPVMALMTCHNGYFLIPDTRSFTEQMLVANGAGAVATFASTGMNLPQPQKVLDEGFFEAIFQQGFTQLGQATHHAKQVLLANFPGERDTSDTYGLMGDPAMNLASDSHTVSTPSVPSGPATGETNTSYTYTTGGSTCSHGHAVEYRFDWGDGTQSSWSTSARASHEWSSAGTYSVRAEARCSVTTSILSSPSGALTVTISTPQPPHTVSTPTTPGGPTSGEPNTSYTYTTGGSLCSHGHAVEYRFDWGDGSYSPWSTSTRASHKWVNNGTYTIRAEARCSVTTSILSSPSGALTVTISTPQPPHTVSTPTTPGGPTSGAPNTFYTCTTGGSLCSHGHAVEYRFDWGDGSYSPWSTSTRASHTWVNNGTYTIRAKARCSIMVTIVSSPSPEKMIKITTPHSQDPPTNPPFEPVNFGETDGSACFIATAAYGSLLDPHVDALRSFRDQRLLVNPVGRKLVKAYYALSPPAARWIKNHANIRALTRIALTPLVAIAQLELNRALAICLVLLLLTSPLAWTHCLAKVRKKDGRTPVDQ